MKYFITAIIALVLFIPAQATADMTLTKVIPTAWVVKTLTACKIDNAAVWAENEFDSAANAGARNAFARQWLINIMADKVRRILNRQAVIDAQIKINVLKLGDVWAE